MSDKLVLIIVVVVVIAAHYWLYRWVKQRIDDGVIVHTLEEVGRPLDTEALVAATGLTASRVEALCRASSVIVEQDRKWNLVVTEEQKA